MEIMDESPKKIKSIKNAEKRRERSKVAARCRRGKESEIFNDLSASLPIPQSSKAGLDKASVMRLILCDLKLKNMMETGLQSCGVTGTFNEEFESLINNALGGFILIFSMDGDILFASDGITTHLGITQFDIMGQSIFDFSHQYDHNDIRNLLTVKKGEKDESCLQRSGLFRMKSTVTSRGRNAHLRSANYKVVNCIGRVVYENDSESAKKWFVSVCEPLLHPSDVDIPLNKQTFLSKHTPDMKFEYVDDSVAELMGYKPENMLGKSFFDFHHAADGEGIGKSFKSLYEKDQNQTERYRFLTKGGGWIWIITQATVIYATNGKTPNAVVCINFITSGREEVDTIVSEVQMGESAYSVVVENKTTESQADVTMPLAARNVLSEIKVNTNTNTVTPSSSPAKLNGENMSKVDMIRFYTAEENKFITDLISGPLLNNATCSTSKIFTPKTDDMDTGFLMPVDNTLIESKEEPDDLTHLAPIAGDECVPLDVPLLEDLLASLDEADMEYSFLDPDSEEANNYAWNGIPSSNMYTQGGGSLTEEKNLYSSSILHSDPPMMNSPDSRSSLFSPYRDSRSPSPARLVTSNNSELCNSPPPPFHQIQMEEPFYCMGRLSSSTSPLPPESAIQNQPMQMDIDLNLNAPNIYSTNNLSGNLNQRKITACQVDTSARDTRNQMPIKSDEIFWRDKVEGRNQTTSNLIKINREIPATATREHMIIPSDRGGLLLPTSDTRSQLAKISQSEGNQNWTVINGGSNTGQPPNKMTKLLSTMNLLGDGQESCDDSEESPSIYILVPLTKRRTSLSSNQSSNSNSGSDNESSVGTSFELMNLVQGVGNNKLDELLCNMGMQVDSSHFASALFTKNRDESHQHTQRVRKRDFAGSLLSDRPVSFNQLTRLDCEVNAPLSKTSELLQGPEILQALETGFSTDSNIL